MTNPRAQSAFDSKKENSRGSRLGASSDDKYEEFIDTPSGVVSLSRLMHDNEIQRRDSTDLLFKNMLLKMASKRVEIMNQFWQRQEREYETRLNERRRREEEILKGYVQDERAAEIERERANQEYMKRSQIMKTVLENQLQTARLLEELNGIHFRICQCHNEFVNYLRSQNEVPARDLDGFEARSFDIVSSANALNDRCKTGNVSVSDVQNLQKLEVELKMLKTSVDDHIRISKENAIKVTAPPPQIDSRKTETEPPPVIAKSEPKETPDETQLNQYYSKKSFETYVQSMEYLSNFEMSLNDLLQDPSLKKFRFDCQKAVNTPINAISSLNNDHIRDKYEKLSRLLNGETVLVNEKYVSASQHPEGISYCKNLLARKIVQQGELLVSSNPEAAFPIASVATALWAKFPDLGELMHAHFLKRCPYLVPMMMPQTVDLTDEEFYRLRGYTYDDDGNIEKQDKFLKRMSGIFKLYSAVWVSRVPRSIRSPHPRNLSHAWGWLVDFVGLNSEVDISATLIHDFISVCGHDCLKFYKIQFIKLLKFMLTDYLVELNKIDEGGPKTRLDVLLYDIIQNNRISPPKGLDSVHRW